MALLYRERVDDLFKALEDEQTYLEASEGIRRLVGRIVVSPAVGDRAELWLEGDLAAILSLAAGRKIPTNAEDGRVLQSLSAGEAETFGQKRKNRPQGAVQANAPEVLTSLVAGAYTRHRLLHVAWDIFGENDIEYPIDKDTLLGIKPPMPW